jgi:hypothetical protein
MGGKAEIMPAITCGETQQKTPQKDATLQGIVDIIRSDAGLLVISQWNLFGWELEADRPNAYLAASRSFIVSGEMGA